MAGGALWLVVVCALCACDVACDNNDYWSDCNATRNNIMFMKPLRIRTRMNNLHLHNCSVPRTVDLQNMFGVAGLQIESNIVNIIAPKFDCHLFKLSIISAMSWRNLPYNWFRTCQDLDHLTYSHVNISDAPDNFLAGLEKLSDLELSYGSLNRIPPFFSNRVFSNLNFFFADYNQISNITDAMTFASAENLYILSLSFNYIEFLHADLFKPLRYIQIIDLNNNRLKYIPEALFQNKQDLNQVDLSHNQIESVPFNAFAGTSIKIVLLNNNRLTHLPVNFISNLHRIKGLEKFTFHGNRWDCACLNNILITIKQLRVGYNKDNFDGTHQECFINKSRFIVQYNFCT